MVRMGASEERHSRLGADNKAGLTSFTWLSGVHLNAGGGWMSQRAGQGRAEQRARLGGSLLRARSSKLAMSWDSYVGIDYQRSTLIPGPNAEGPSTPVPHVAAQSCMASPSLGIHGSGDLLML